MSVTTIEDDDWLGPKVEKETCPECGGEVHVGYGFAGGGLGGYMMCLDCDWFEQSPDPVAEEA